MALHRNYAKDQISRWRKWNLVTCIQTRAKKPMPTGKVLQAALAYHTRREIRRCGVKFKTGQIKGKDLVIVFVVQPSMSLGARKLRAHAYRSSSAKNRLTRRQR